MAVEQLAQPADVLAAWPAFGALPASEQASLLSTASQRILSHCRREGFAQAGVTDVLDGTGLARVWLTRKPVITISTVTINGVAVDNTTGSAWSFNSRTGELRRGDGYSGINFAMRYPLGRGNVVVAYWAGYVAVPDPVVRATIWAVRWLSDQLKVSGIYSSESIGDYSYSLNAAAMSLSLPTHIASLLCDFVLDDGPY